MYGTSQLFRCPFHRPDEAYFLVLEAEKESESHVKLTQFMVMMESIVQLLKKAENVKIAVFEPGAAATAIASNAKPVLDAQGKPLPASERVRAPGEGGIRMLGGMLRKRARTFGFMTPPPPPPVSLTLCRRR